MMTFSRRSFLQSLAAAAAALIGAPAAARFLPSDVKDFLKRNDDAQKGIGGRLSQRRLSQISSLEGWYMTGMLFVRLYPTAPAISYDVSVTVTFKDGTMQGFLDRTPRSLISIDLSGRKVVSVYAKARSGDQAIPVAVHFLPT